MADKQLNIFIVDDEPIARMIAVEELAGHGYRLVEFASGEACLPELAQKPDILLLDIEMPGMDGVALCRALRATSDEQTQVIFISAHDDLETRMAAYDAGGNDYMVKPYAAEELAKKIGVAERALGRKQQLAAQADYAQKAAFTAMSSMGEMGTVLDFLRTSFGCHTPVELARALFSALAQYGLQGFVELRIGAECECHSSSQDQCTALEISILGHARKLDRIFQFRDRLSITYPNVTLLITHLPLDDPDRVGRYRDHLATIVEGAESRLAAMMLERQRQDQANAIVEAIAELTDMLAEIESRQGGHRMDMIEVTAAYLQELNSAFIHLGLTEGQEASLISLAHDAHERIHALLDDGTSLGDQLRRITTRLRTLTQGAQESV
jgi:DNA-binding response OmpR family regulator